MRSVKTKSVLGYMLLPGFIPQARGLFASGFGYIAFLMAQIYAIVRLLPANHPYLQSSNIGQFGIRHVIAEAANNLEFKKDNWDQITIFITLLFGMVLLAGQIALIIFSLLFQPTIAEAAGSYFTTPTSNGTYSADLAFSMMDRVFGIPDMFCAGDNVPGKAQCTDILGSERWPFHVALHEMFRFYSMGLLMVALLIFLYYIVTVVGETALSGTPFGQRFQNIWVPIRLVIALGLLTPIHYGLNTAQYITLTSAKWGSGLATNSWRGFNETLKTRQKYNANPTGESNTLLALPNSPDMTPIIEFMSLVHGCAYSHWRLNNNIGGDNNDISKAPPYNGSNQHYIKAYYIKSDNPLYMPAGIPDNERWKHIRRPMKQDNFFMGEYTNALDFYNNGDIIIRFGRYSSDDLSKDPSKEFSEYKGGIEPTCGEIRLTTSDLTYRGEGMTFGGSAFMQEVYFMIIQDLWFNMDDIRSLSQRSAELSLQVDPTKGLQCKIGCQYDILPSCAVGVIQACQDQKPSSDARQEFINGYNSLISSYVVQAWDLYNKNASEAELKEEILDYGWAGAGIWYNTISKINGGFINSVTSIPQATRYPMIMEKVRDKKLQTDTHTSPDKMFEPTLAGKGTLEMDANERRIANALNEIYQYWNTDGANQADNDKIITGNAFEDSMNLIFGTQGLFAMKSAENANIHPLAQLSALGKGLVDSAITNVAISSTMAALGGPLRAIGANNVGTAAGIVGGITGSTAFIGLTAGVVLYYILPFLPFAYFFFAVASWVKGIFEAMVGVPLWALAHLRLDGEGLAGDAAIGGYQLILEIFIRPVLTVFGLIASMIIFTAQVRILHFIWDLVISNVGGFEGDATTGLIGNNIEIKDANGKVIKTMIPGFHIKRGILDQFFFTITYAIIVYMMATASFKLINLIPNNMLRWMGASVSPFGDMQQEPAQGLLRYGAMGGMTIGQQVVGDVKQLAQGTGTTLGELMASKPKAPPEPPAPAQPPAPPPKK